MDKELEKLKEFIKFKRLEEEYEDYVQESEWEIKTENGLLWLYGNNEYKAVLCSQNNFGTLDIVELVYLIANHMNYLATKEQLFDGTKNVYCVYYDICAEEWQVSWNMDAVDASFIIDTKENAQKIADFLNKSEDLKDWVEVK